MSSLRGRVKDNVLSFYWTEDGGQGAGKFTLSADGQSFSGTLSAGTDPNDTSGGTWNGTRVPTFAGAWQGKMGETYFLLIMQQTGIQVTGQLKVNSADFGMIREGHIIGNTLRFRLVRGGKVLFNGSMSPEEFVGNGELTMEPGGKSFKGTLLGVAANAPFLGR